MIDVSGVTCPAAKPSRQRIIFDELGGSGRAWAAPSQRSTRLYLGGISLLDVTASMTLGLQSFNGAYRSRLSGFANANAGGNLWGRRVRSRL